jgi:hypothetical protein
VTAGEASGLARRVRAKAGGSGDPEAGDSRRIRDIRREAVVSSGRRGRSDPEPKVPGRRQAMYGLIKLMIILIKVI